ncbi:MAG: hypothetical protein V4598_12315 [Bdellovibrionota bacterium]
MKVFILMMVVSLSCEARTLKRGTTPKTIQPKTTETKPVHPALKKEEDCDDKAKKPIEIKPETISLGGGNTGCSLPE